jgi:methionyl-tRNA formyltransferase
MNGVEPSPATASPRRVAFVGNRPLVFDAALAFRELSIEWTWVVAGSLLERRLLDLGRPFTAFSAADGPTLIGELLRTPFDLLISSGCPLRLPVSQLSRPGRLLLNVHPSPLPDMRGLHPINGALLYDRKLAGATMHHLRDGLDTGPVISQELLEVTGDLDLGLLYHVIFRLEAAVFTSGMLELIESGFSAAGKEQTGETSNYSRQPEDARIDPAGMDDAEILRRVRAFGVGTQGTICPIGGATLRVFDVRLVTHPALLAEFAAVPPGEVALAYDGKLLVKTRQSLALFTSFSVIEGDLPI